MMMVGTDKQPNYALYRTAASDSASAPGISDARFTASAR